MQQRESLQKEIRSSLCEFTASLKIIIRISSFMKEFRSRIKKKIFPLESYVNLNKNYERVKENESAN